MLWPGMDESGAKSSNLFGRATLKYAIGAECRRFYSSVWRQYRGENCAGGAVDEPGQCLPGLGFSAAARTE